MKKFMLRTVTFLMAMILCSSVFSFESRAAELPDSYPFKGGTVDFVVKPIFDMGEYFNGSFYDGLTRIVSDAKVGHVNKFGETVIPAIYGERGGYFSEGLAAVEKDGKLGYIDKEGNTVIAFEYDGRNENFNEGMAFVSKDGENYGFINKEGKAVTAFIYEGPGMSVNWSVFNEGLAPVRRDGGLYGYIDTKGELVIPHKYYIATRFSEGLAWTTSGYINKSGEVVIPLDKYDNLTSGFNDGYAQVLKDDKYGLIDKNGKLILPTIYERLSSVHEGVVVARLDGKDRIIDVNGKVIFQSDDFVLGRFDSGFSEGLITVDKDGKYGYMDSSGEIVVPLIFDSTYGFSEGLAWVELDGKWGVLEINAAATLPAPALNLGEGVTVSYPVTSKAAKIEITDCPSYGDRSQPFVSGRLSEGDAALYELVTLIKVNGRYYGKKPFNTSMNVKINAGDNSFSVRYSSNDGVGSDWNAESILICMIPAGVADGISPSVSSGYTVPASQISALKNKSVCVAEISRERGAGK